MTDLVTIAGNMGEGGGQVLRTSLALSLATGRPLAMHAIRARRSQPGLRRQHVTAVQAAQRVGYAAVEGAEVGSQTLRFEPQGCHAGIHHLRVGSAGSACLVIQTVLPVLLFTGGASELRIEGGTHTHFAPPYEYLADVYLPLLRAIGAEVRSELVRAGFFPVGGGQIRVAVGARTEVKPLTLIERGRHRSTEARALISRLPRHIADRELDIVRRKLALTPRQLRVEERTEAAGPGNALMIRIEHEHVTEVFTAYGKQGVSAESVAAGACREARAWSKSDAPVGPHLADQLMLPLALGSGGTFRTGPLTRHSRTNLDVIRRFLELPIEVEPVDAGLVEVRIGTWIRSDRA